MGSVIDWIKISTKIFSNRKIKFILSNKKGDKFFKIWIQLLTLAGTINDRGEIYLTKGVPYNATSLGVELGEPAKVISEALKIFETLEMIRVSEGVIVVNGWEKHQNVEAMERAKEQNRNRVRKFREKQKVMEDETITVMESNITVMEQNKNKNKNIDIDNNYHHHLNNIVSIKCDTCNDDDDGLNNQNNVFALWEHCGLGTISSWQAEKIKALIDETSEIAVCEAIESAARYNARNFAYVSTVAHRIASGDNTKPDASGGFSGFGAIFEKLKKEADEEDGQQENSL